MDDLRLPEKNTATTNSLEVVVKAFAGFGIGLIATIWAVPGVPDAVIVYIKDNWVTVGLTMGIPSAISTGLVNLFFDWRKKGLRNY